MKTPNTNLQRSMIQLIPRSPTNSLTSLHNLNDVTIFFVSPPGLTLKSIAVKAPLLTAAAPTIAAENVTKNMKMGAPIPPHHSTLLSSLFRTIIAETMKNQNPASNTTHRQNSYSLLTQSFKFQTIIPNRNSAEICSTTPKWFEASAKRSSILRASRTAQPYL